MSISESLLTNVLKPKELKHILLTKRVRAAIGNSTDLYQNYLFEGSPGIGKTSLAYILANGRPTCYINSSDERGLDVIRDKIVDFCKTKDATNPNTDYKVIIFDEFDGATESFFKALRATMDKFSHKVRFIATCNYLNKIPDPIKSRFGNVIKFDPIDSDEENELKLIYKKRIEGVTTQLGMTWESKEVLDEFLNKSFPDLRMIFTKIQTFQIQGVQTITLSDVLKTSYTFDELFSTFFQDNLNPMKTYQTVMVEYQNKIKDIFNSLNKELPKYIEDKHPQKIPLLPKICKSSVEWEYRSSFVDDKASALLACIYDIQEIIQGKK